MIDDLNDPFEWFSVTGDRKVRGAVRKLRSKLGSQYGFVCLSDSWQHPLLWAHYADKHRGLCLGFDVIQSTDLLKVEYVKERVNWREIKNKQFEEVGPKVLNFLNTKFDAWAYETEFRMVVPLDSQVAVQDTVSGLYFRNFAPGMLLKQVLVGERCNVGREHLNRVLGASSEEVESFKVRPGFMKFEIVRNRKRSDWK